MINAGFWKNASSRRKRILSTIVILVVAVVVTLLGTLMPTTPQQAKTISNDLNQTINSLKPNDALTPYIFGNNFMICLVMFIPIVGPIFGFYALFNTGTAIGAVATTQGFPAIFVFLAELILPIFWLEFTAYSIAIAESIWFVRRLLQRTGKREIKNLGILVTICAVVLLISAIIETAIISAA